MSSLIYISPRDMRKNRSDPVHIINSCDAFARLGYDVELVTPRIWRSEYKKSKDSLSELYGFEPSFRITEYLSLMTDRTGALLGRPQKLLGGLLTAIRCWSRLRDPNTIIYIKCPAAGFPLIALKRAGWIRASVIFEKPDFDDEDRLHRWTCKSVDGIVAGNKYIRDQIEEGYGIAPERLYAVTAISQYHRLLQLPVRNRSELQFRPDRRHVVYAGKLSAGRAEIEFIVEAARLVPEVDFIVIGGLESGVSHYQELVRREGLSNLRFIGFLPVPELWAYLSHADILLSYYDTQDVLSMTQRNPGKMTLYSCAGKPIILSDIPSMRELFSEDQVFFVPPDRPPELARKVREILSSPVEAARRSDQMKIYAAEIDYSQTYRKVVEFIRGLGRARTAAPEVKNGSESDHGLKTAHGSINSAK